MNILQPALLVPLFSSLYSCASLTPLSPTVPEGNGNCFLWRTRGQWSRRHSVYSSPGGNRHVGNTASFAAPEPDNIMKALI
jgi:hypothetical protein